MCGAARSRAWVYRKPRQLRGSRAGQKALTWLSPYGIRQSQLGGEINHELIKGMLVHRARGAADASAVAEAAVSTWHEAALRLAPVIGGQGVDVLFRRSLHVTAKTFPDLDLVGKEADHCALLASLQAHLAVRDAALALSLIHI